MSEASRPELIRGCFAEASVSRCEQFAGTEYCLPEPHAPDMFSSSKKHCFTYRRCAIIGGMLDKLERKIGKYAIKNLIYYILGGYLVGYILYFTNARLGWYNYIVLDPALVMKGQVWRLFTWICTIPQGISIFLIFMFLLYYFIGKNLENYLGAFRYNLYIFSGWFFMTLGAMAFYWITGVSMNVSTYYINLASFLAFAVLFPDTRIYLFGLIPIRMKWLAIFDIVYLGIQIVSGVILLVTIPSPEVQSVLSQFGMGAGETKIAIITEIFSIIISLLNFVIFFLMTRKMKRITPQEVHRRSQFRKGVNQGMAENQARTAQQQSRGNSGPYVANGVIVHRCSVCGRTNLTNPELTFRYCSKCEGNHEYCQDHLFTHVHVK